MGRTRRPLLGGARRRQLRRRDQIPLSAEPGRDRAWRRHRLPRDQRGTARLRRRNRSGARRADDDHLRAERVAPAVHPARRARNAGPRDHAVSCGQSRRLAAGARPLRRLAGNAPLADTTGPIPYPALYDLTAVAGVSRPHAIRNGYMRALTDETIEIMREFVNRPTSLLSLIPLRELGGAMATTSSHSTPTSARRVCVSARCAGSDLPDGRVPIRFDDRLTMQQEVNSSAGCAVLNHGRLIG
jgi:hypothetical protein